MKWRRGWGKGFHVASISVEVVPNGLWPLDFGGPLGEPVTRGIEAKLPWWNCRGQSGGRGHFRRRDCRPAMRLIQKQVFTRKQ